MIDELYSDTTQIAENGRLYRDEQANLAGGAEELPHLLPTPEGLMRRAPDVAPQLAIEVLQAFFPDLINDPMHHHPIWINFLREFSVRDAAFHGAIITLMADQLWPREARNAYFVGYGIHCPQARETGELPSTEPLPLRRELQPPEPYPIEMLGGILAPMTRRMMDVIKAPDAICGQSVLAATTFAAQRLRNISIDGRIYPLSEFFITLGDSGSRKSAADEVALLEHRRYEDELYRAFRAEMLAYQNNMDVYRRSRDEVLKLKGLDEKRGALDTLGPPPDPPLHPMIFASEPTVEGLYKLLASGHPSIGLFADEGGQFLGGHGMTAENLLKTAAWLSKAWDGRTLTRVRGGDGASGLRGRRVSVHLMVQPGIAQRVLSNATLVEQGLLSRCLVAWPQSLAGTRTYVAANLQADAAVQKFYRRMSGLLKIAPVVATGTTNELTPPSLELSAPAKALWDQFHDHVEKQLGDDGPLAPIRGFASKAAEHVLRLAGVLALVDAPETLVVGDTYIQCGIELVQYYLQEALRLFNASVTDPEIALAEKLLSWAQGRDNQHIFLQLVYQFGPNQIRDAKTAKRIVGILESHGWLTKLDGGMPIDGVYRREVWRVHR